MAIVVRPSDEPFERLLHQAFGLRVERRRRLVEHEDGRVAEHGARNRHALLLAAGEPVAALADDRVVALGERGDQVVDLGCPRGGLHLRVRGARLREAEVLPHGLVEEIGLLRHDSDRSS